MEPNRSLKLKEFIYFQLANYFNISTKEIEVQLAVHITVVYIKMGLSNVSKIAIMKLTKKLSMLKGHLAMLYNYTDKKCIKTCFLASVINFNCNKNNQMFINEMLHQNQKVFKSKLT